MDLLQLRADQTVLITGAIGGVGGFAVQLAAAAGHHVIAVASRGDEERVRGLGAAEVLGRSDDLVADLLAGHPQGVDAVLDAVPVGPQLIGAVRDGGAFVTTLDPAAPTAERRVRVAKVSVTPRPDQLTALLEAAAAGALQTAVALRMPLGQAQRALDAAAAGGLRGKVVLVP